MRRRILIPLSFLLLLIGPASLVGAQQPIQLLISTSQPSTQPTTQAAHITIEQAEQARSIYEQIWNTKIAGYLRGDKPLTWEDIKDPSWWFYNFKDLIVTMVAFVPRLVGTL